MEYIVAIKEIIVVVFSVLGILCIAGASLAIKDGRYKGGIKGYTIEYGPLILGVILMLIAQYLR